MAPQQDTGDAAGVAGPGEAGPPEAWYLAATIALTFGPSDRHARQVPDCSESGRKGQQSSSAQNPLSKTASFQPQPRQEREEARDSCPLPSLKETRFPVTWQE